MKLIKNLVTKLCDRNIQSQIEVKPFYDVFSELVHSMEIDDYEVQLKKYSCHPQVGELEKILTQTDFKNFVREKDKSGFETADNTWEEFYNSIGFKKETTIAESMLFEKWDEIDASRYLKEECDLIRSALSLIERKKYINDFPRIGRTIDLDPEDRAKVLRVLALYEEWMLAGSILDVQELTQITSSTYKKIIKLSPEKRSPYRCLLVDEYQDFSTLDLRILGFWPREKKRTVSF